MLFQLIIAIAITVLSLSAYFIIRRMEKDGTIRSKPE